jgi:hypothetical protein
MNYPMYLAFLKWCFVKTFGSTFDKLASFRYQLKQGAPDSIFAIVGFAIMSLVFVMVITLISAGLLDDTNIVKHIFFGSVYLACFTLIYNVVKAAFECFLEEREELIERLKR